MAIALIVMTVTSVQLAAHPLSFHSPFVFPDLSDDDNSDDYTDLDIGLGARDGTVHSLDKTVIKPHERCDPSIELLGLVSSDDGPINGAQVILSKDKMGSFEDFEEIRAKDSWYLSHVSSNHGLYVFSCLERHSTYWIMAGAAYHYPVFRILYFVGDTTTVLDIKLQQKPLRWSAEDTITRGDPEFRFDLTQDEPFIGYGFSLTPTLYKHIEPHF